VPDLRDPAQQSIKQTGPCEISLLDDSGEHLRQVWAFARNIKAAQVPAMAGGNQPGGEFTSPRNR
jgi:hypothetical protein